MSDRNLPSSKRQVYLLGVTDDASNSWEELIEASGLDGIIRYLEDHNLELMYAKRIDEAEAAQWNQHGNE